MTLSTAKIIMSVTDKLPWNISAMKLTGKNQSTLIKMYSSTTLSTTKTTWNGQ